MKTLVVVRHAKSSWADFSLADIDRPLNDRGKKDAPEMAKRIKDKGIVIDAFVSSPAKRARKTAKLFAEEWDKSKKDIELQEALYEAGVPQFEQVMQELNNEWNTVALFSHNPGITDFVNSLTDTRVDDMPTCAVYAVQIETDNWQNATAATKKFLFFDYPKNEPEA